MPPRTEEAIGFRRVAVAFRPDSPGARVSLGVAQFVDGAYADAEDAFREAVRLRPDFAMYHNNLGVVLFHQQKSDQAEIEYREAIRLKPDYELAHRNLGKSLAKQGSQWCKGSGMKPQQNIVERLNYLRMGQRRLRHGSSYVSTWQCGMRCSIACLKSCQTSPRCRLAEVNTMHCEANGQKRPQAMSKQSVCDLSALKNLIEFSGLLLLSGDVNSISTSVKNWLTDRASQPMLIPDCALPDRVHLARRTPWIPPALSIGQQCAPMG